jgi:uncharacterized protein (DUF302 family)
VARTIQEGTMTSSLDDYAFRVELDADYETAMLRARDALKGEGFGIISEIDVQATLKEKIGVDFRRYSILGACKPVLANRALSAEPEVGLLLPCNVIVYDRADGDGSVVSLVDPLSMLGGVMQPELQAVAAEAHARLSRVAEALRT